MNSFAEPLAQNVYIVAIANIGALVGFVFLVIAGLRRAIAFGKVAYKNNVKVAIARSKRRMVVRSRECSIDVYIYLSTFINYSARLLLMTLVLAMSSFSSIGLPAINASSPESFRMGEVFATTMSYAFMGITALSAVMFFSHITALAALARNVLRLRRKFRRIAIRRKSLVANP